MQVRSFRRAGRLVPPRPHGLKARSVVLRPGAVMDWHSTREREELILVLRGQVRLECELGRRTQRVRVAAGQSLLIPRRTPHRVVNRSRSTAQYVYITAR